MHQRLPITRHASLATAMLLVGLTWGLGMVLLALPPQIPALLPWFGSEHWSIASPNGRLRLVVTRDAGNGRLFYQAYHDKVPLIDRSPLGLRTADQQFVSGLRLVDQRETTLASTYTMPTGKRHSRNIQANEHTFQLVNSNDAPIETVFRVSDDGFAFRYRLTGSGSTAIVGDESGFALPQGATVWAVPFELSYEERYRQQHLDGSLKAGHYGFPLLFSTGSRWALLSEAGLDGRSGASSITLGPDNEGLLRLQLPDASVRGALPWATPWRVAIVGASLGTVVESTLVDDLSLPGRAVTPSWVRPGRVAWSWWADSQSTRNLDIQKQYVDMAAALGWEYLLLDEGWREEWLPEIVSYAGERGVGVIVWARWSDLADATAREQFLDRWRDAGVKGVKVDFLRSDGQERMAFYEQLSSATYERHLMLNFHGATLPRGQQRRWPHIMSYEAVYGAEYHKWGKGPSASHNTMLPFTRNVVGSMDYTPVALSAPGRGTTAAHELALAVVFESGWQHFADGPASYLGSVAEPLLRQLPTAWDETRFVAGYPGELAALARRNGEEWYLGAINGGAARSVALPLTFLAPGSYQAELYRDGADGQILTESFTVEAGEVLVAALPRGGGLTLRIVAR